MEAHRRLAGAEDFHALATFEIGVEHEAPLVEALEENHAHIGQARLVDGGERQCVGIVGLGFPGILEPVAKQGVGFVFLGEVTAC